MVPVQQAGGSMARSDEESLTLISGTEGLKEEGGEQEVKEQRKREMDCQSGALMKKMVRWEPSTLLALSCPSRCVRMYNHLCVADNFVQTLHAKTLIFLIYPPVVILCLSQTLHTLIQKGSKDPIPEEEFDFQGLEDEDEDSTDGEKDSSTGDKAERGKVWSYIYIYIPFWKYWNGRGHCFSFALLCHFLLSFLLPFGFKIKMIGLVDR